MAPAEEMMVTAKIVAATAMLVSTETMTINVETMAIDPAGEVTTATAREVTMRAGAEPGEAMTTTNGVMTTTVVMDAATAVTARDGKYQN